MLKQNFHWVISGSTVKRKVGISLTKFYFSDIPIFPCDVLFCWKRNFDKQLSIFENILLAMSRIVLLAMSTYFMLSVHCARVISGSHLGNLLGHFTTIIYILLLVRIHKHSRHTCHGLRNRQGRTLIYGTPPKSNLFLLKLSD